MYASGWTMQRRLYRFGSGQNIGRAAGDDESVLGNTKYVGKLAGAER